MSAFRVDPRDRWLFVFCHPDDELVVAAFLRRLARGGVPVWAVWTHSNPVREAEARRAMRQIGVREDRLAFLGGPDGKILESVPQLCGPLAELARSAAPTRTATLAFEHGHLDHDATNLLVHLACNGTARYEFPLYHTYLTRFPVLNRFLHADGEETIPLSEDEQEFKRALCRCYPSQTVYRNVVWYDRVSRLLGRQGLYQTERMRLQTHVDYRRPNLPPHLARRIEASENWRRWRSAVDRLMDLSGVEG